jgi:hypothetical protein
MEGAIAQRIAPIAREWRITSRQQFPECEGPACGSELQAALNRPTSAAARAQWEHRRHIHWTPRAIMCSFTHSRGDLAASRREA